MRMRHHRPPTLRLASVAALALAALVVGSVGALSAGPPASWAGPGDDSRPPAGQEEPVALVVRVEGEVSVERAGADTGPATVGRTLRAGDRLVPSQGARALLLTRGGATRTVTTTATLEAAPAGGSGAPDLFRRAVRTLARAATNDARTTGGRQGMIRPVPGQTALVAPRNDLMVAGPRPTFRWTATEGARSYTLQLRELDGGAPRRFRVGSATEWTLPVEEGDLERGTRYAWTVAPDGGRPAREARFRILGPDGVAELRGLLDEVRGLGLDPGGEGALLTALVYRDLGLPYEAREALSAVGEEAWTGPELYLLQGDVLSLLGHADEARAAFERADEMRR